LEARQPRVDLFLISFLILFFELSAIRWFGATVVFLTFFTNIVLLACFLGMSVGLLTASQPRNLVRTVLPLLLVSLALGLATMMLHAESSADLTIDVGAQQGSPQLIYFGTEYRAADPGRWVIPIWIVGGTFFSLISLTFVGLGQVMGRAFDAIPDRVAAYTIDVLGSLSGIVAFAAMSYVELAPWAWFMVVVPLMLFFAGRNAVQMAAAAAVLIVVAIGATLPYGQIFAAQVHWSPYYKVLYSPESRALWTNNIGHQQMHDIRAVAPAYLLPHLLNRDAGARPFEDVLVIGAGSGNDVAAALRSGARRIDAVEIDPHIHRIGLADHPNSPYADARVAVHLDDGRSFVRNAARRYDLAVYALVDSLVLHSGYSSLRLENFLFTREAFQEVRKALKPDGVFAMYNYYRQGWVVGRLARMAEEAFGTKPLVISLPYQARIEPGDSQTDRITFLLVSADPARLEGVHDRFARGEKFWLNQVPARNEAVNAFGIRPPGTAAGWDALAPAQVGTAGIEDLPSDDWPQLYLRNRSIPWAPIGQGMLTILVLSAAILLAFTRRQGIAPNAQMFFLGAGFMLLESKGVVHMALLFGGTWVVNSVVFFAILVMILCANLFVLAARPRNLWPYYGLLIAALLVNALVPMNAFLSLAPWMRVAASCAVVFVPIFFAGVVFASVFRDSRRPGADFGANVAGIILGGLSEQLSLVVGFNFLILIAIGYYLLSLAAPLARARFGIRG